MARSVKNIYYYVEGECEEKLVRTLIDDFGLLPPGRIKVFNVKQKIIPKSILLSIKPSSMVVFIFDTDIDCFSFLMENKRIIENMKINLRTILLPQVENLEDELMRCCSIKEIKDLTHSKSKKDFKRDFLKASNLKALLIKADFCFSLLWIQSIPPKLLPNENGKYSLVRNNTRKQETISDYI